MCFAADVRCRSMWGGEPAPFMSIVRLEISTHNPSPPACHANFVRSSISVSHSFNLQKSRTVMQVCEELSVHR